MPDTDEKDKVQENEVQEDKVQEDKVQEDKVQEDSVQEDSVQEDNVRDIQEEKARHQHEIQAEDVRHERALDDMEAQAKLTDKVNRSVADQLESDALDKKREKKVGHSYVDEDTAAAARLARDSYNRDLESVEATLEDKYGPSNAPFVRSTPGPDDAPAFSSSEKSATKDSENKHVVEEPEKLQTETIVGAPPVTEAGVLGEPLPESAKPKDEEDSTDKSGDDNVEDKDEGKSLSDETKDKDKSSVADSTTSKNLKDAGENLKDAGKNLKDGDDLRPDKPAKKVEPAKKATSSSKK